MKDFPELPVFYHLSDVADAFHSVRCAVIEAEPGAGKTMLIPALARETGDGMTILVEPRRIAARSAAHGIARMHNWQTGRETGFAVRGESCRCDKNGILAVTPGILLQMLQKDPALEGVSAIVFDEFHERALETDLALTLVLDMRQSLRDDLLLAVMSATMESRRIGDFLNAPVISIPGRGFPVTVNCREISADYRELPKNVAAVVMENLPHADGDILVFLPGAGEIAKCREILQERADDNFILHSLHGSLPLTEQQQCIAPAPDGKKKIILATNIAESSLTVDGVTMVIDSGWEKQAVWHPGAGMSFLENRRITKDSAGQRAGRAGRTAPGRAIRCFTQLQYDRLPGHRTPELLSADLSSLLLQIRCWGSDVNALQWLDQPPQSSLAAAEKLLKELRLLDSGGRPTAKGKRAATLPLSPRIGAMMLDAPASLRMMAAELAALLEEKDDFFNFATADLLARVQKMHSSGKNQRIRQNIISRLLKEFPPEASGEKEDPGILIAAAFPEWIGKNRAANGTVFQLAGGGAASLDSNDPLREAEFLAIARLDGSGSGSGNSTIRLAMALQKQTLETFFADRITGFTETVFDQASGKLLSFTGKKLGELILQRTPSPVPPQAGITALLKEACRRNIALPPPEDKRACALLQRIRFSGIITLPENMEDLLLPLVPFFPEKISSFNDLKKVNWFDLLGNLTDYAQKSELDRLCPEFFTSPAGMRFPIDYSGEQPSLAIPVQQLYGTKEHPVIGKKRLPLRVELLSPAHRPVQISCDIPGFWRGSWKLVRSEMRSRYPKHEWPEDPANASPMRNSVKKHRQG